MRSQDLLFFCFICLFLVCSCGRLKRGGEVSGETQKERLQISGSFALYPLAVKWAEEFQKIHPEVKIDISGGGSGKGMTDVLTGMVDIGLLSRSMYQEEVKKGGRAIAVVKDAVLPTINIDNPVFADIRKKGLSLPKAQGLWGGEFSTWGEVLDSQCQIPVHIFTRSDACGAAETFAEWLGKRQEDLAGTAVFGDPGLAAAIQNDKVGIGYNNIAYVYDLYTRKPYEGLAVIPIDLDGNGNIDRNEDFYDTSHHLSNAIEEGKYPTPPARELYMVIKERPTGIVKEFLRYVLTQGQKFVYEIGYIPMPAQRLELELKKLE